MMMVLGKNRIISIDLYNHNWQRLIETLLVLLRRDLMVNKMMNDWILFQVNDLQMGNVMSLLDYKMFRMENYQNLLHLNHLYHSRMNIERYDYEN